MFTTQVAHLILHVMSRLVKKERSKIQNTSTPIFLNLFTKGSDWRSSRPCGRNWVQVIQGSWSFSERAAGSRRGVKTKENKPARPETCGCQSTSPDWLGECRRQSGQIMAQDKPGRRTREGHSVSGNLAVLISGPRGGGGKYVSLLLTETEQIQFL